MAGPFQHGSSAFPEPASPAGISTPSSRNRFSLSSNFYTHPSRTSLLESSAGDITHGGAAGYGSFMRPDTLDMDSATASSSPRPWRGGLPSFSRAFNMLLAAETGGTPPKDDDEGFFIPSYLEGSTYVQKLEEAYRSKTQARESAGNASNRLSATLATTSPHQQAHLPHGSHRGMSHTVIERASSVDSEESLAPLPSKWNKDDQWGNIEIQPDGLSVKYIGPKNQHDREHEACAVRADHFMPPQCGIYYYEVHILSAKRDDATIGIGFTTKTATLSRPVGWEPEAWGYHGDDGRCFTGQNIGRHYGPIYNAGDVIGCGVNFRDHTAFFTKNGVKIATAFHNISQTKLYPAVSLKKSSEHVRVNFGQTPFVYNIDDMMKEERESVQNEIETTETSLLVPGMNETDLVQSLVLQFLQHDGYIETARAFAEDMQSQKEALTLEPSAAGVGVNIRDDEDANNRQRIRRAILEGDIDRALKYTNAYYPRVLQGNEQVYFRLRCRRFIEMVRKAAQLNSMAESQKSNGLMSQSAPQDMDLDMNGNIAAWADAAGVNETDRSSELLELERSMIEYGQALQAQYANDPRKEVTKALNEIWALVAYPNPLKEPQVSHLLDKKGRVAVAEELNSAILLSLGKSSRASLEKLYAQTSVLLEDLRQDGGEGAFISIKDILEDIPHPTQT